MAFRASISQLFWPPLTPEAVERAKQPDASMDEFFRLLHTNGYDSKISATFGAMAGPSERPSCEQDAQHSKQEGMQVVADRRHPIGVSKRVRNHHLTDG
ncbi:hypothetical protein [Tardiphaga sp. OK246]|jgi:hypothetical protein|uniref:hypothetical protein n=1 Tax=Tardiphaga sp. OK246 TaxID=1855307 RepID=UPI000B79827A|nr:hypothetical protein [Tardiphaga sp. OK246]